MSSLIKKCAAVVLRDKKFLIVRQQNQDYFKNVGGKLERSESPEECLSREIYEELAVETKSTCFYWKVPKTKAVSNPELELEIYLYFVEIEGPIKASSEIAECAWISK